MALHTYHAMAERCVVVLYLMAEGDEHKPLGHEAFFRECVRLRIFEMTVDEFTKFKKKAIDPSKYAAKLREGDQ